MSQKIDWKLPNWYEKFLALWLKSIILEIMKRDIGLHTPIQVNITFTGPLLLLENRSGIS